MKAYIVEVAEPLIPFGRPASALEFGHETLRQRLERQFGSVTGDLVEVAPGETLRVTPGSIVVYDNILVSDSFFSDFLAQIPDKAKAYQCHVDISKSPLLVEAAAPQNWQPIQVFYTGSQTQFQANDAEPLQVEWPSILTLDRGVPEQMHQQHNLRAYFRTAYAQQIDYWFDLQTASGLYVREHVSKIVSLARRWLPEFLVNLILNWQWFMERSNRIGKNCRIHRTAILEGCVIGDNVEIGPHTFLQSSVVADGAILREQTTLKMSYIGPGSFVLGSDIVNSYVGSKCSVITPMLYNVVLGTGSFISGGTGFADVNAGSGQVTANINGEDIPSGLSALGSCVGEECFIGANMIFAPGRVIPSGSRFLDNGLIRNVPTEPDGTYILSNNQFLQIPASFIGAQSK
jgi:acetyltransferase-like isoleucine patch superfamily enzyme